VPGIERVESDDIHGFLGEIGGVLFEDGSEVFIVGESHMETVKSTVLGVDAEIGV
jgi:hypothetical protein